MVPRHVPVIGYFGGDGGFGRLLVLVGVVLAALFWLGLGAGSVFSGIGGISAAASGRGGDVLPTAALSVGVGALVLLLAQAIHWQRRTAARLRLREEELTEQRDRLRRYVADLERIADVAAHDLQEPLRRVVSYSQLLAGHDSAGCDDEVRDYVGHVVDGAHRMRALVSGLWEFVAVDSIPRTGEVCPAWVAMGVARQRLAEVLAEVGTVLVVDPLPEVEADQASLTEIFVQLLGNAVRYRSRERRLVIRVSVALDDGMARITIRDNGLGIDSARMARMFEIFHRSHGDDLGAAPGIGIGLAVVRRLVERLGGRVWVESEIGVGSSFGFSLRLDARPTQQHEETAAA